MPPRAPCWSASVPTLPFLIRPPMACILGALVGRLRLRHGDDRIDQRHLGHFDFAADQSRQLQAEAERFSRRYLGRGAEPLLAMPTSSATRSSDGNSEICTGPLTRRR